MKYRHPDARRQVYNIRTSVISPVTLSALSYLTGRFYTISPNLIPNPNLNPNPNPNPNLNPNQYPDPNPNPNQDPNKNPKWDARRPISYTIV